jgi:hypothetical protein
MLWNNFLAEILPSNQTLSDKFHKVIYHKNHRPIFLQGQIRTLDFLGLHSLHVIDSPQVIINRFPHYLSCLQSLEGVSRYQLPKNKEKLKVAIHIRQGELSLSQFKSRFLPLSYFESILEIVSGLLTKKGLDFEVKLFMEPNQEKLVEESDLLIKDSLKLDPSNPNLIRVGNNKFRISNETPSMSKTPHLYAAQLHLLKSAYETFLNLISADILVISKSSFSYLAGLLNTGSLVIYPMDWDPPLSHWILPDTKDTFRANLNLWIDNTLSS